MRNNKAVMTISQLMGSEKKFMIFFSTLYNNFVVYYHRNVGLIRSLSHIHFDFDLLASAAITD